MVNITELKFDAAGLIPAIVQDADTRVVLMQGYMNRESLVETERSGKVCFFSRSRQRLWTKGEESGHFLRVKEVLVDCDRDSLLVKVNPVGPTCHTGQDTCWGEKNVNKDFLFYLQRYLEKRKDESLEISYTARLIGKGINKVAQKVGEEAVELVIEAKDDNEELFLNEAAGQDTCWGEKNVNKDFLFYLQRYLEKRKDESLEISYTARLIGKGINKVAQKVGEEAVELVIEAKDDNEELFLNEAADLMYHYIVLLIAKGYGLEDVVRVLEGRHGKDKS